MLQSALVGNNNDDKHDTRDTTQLKLESAKAGRRKKVSLSLNWRENDVVVMCDMRTYAIASRSARVGLAE